VYLSKVIVFFLKQEGRRKKEEGRRKICPLYLSPLLPFPRSPPLKYLCPQVVSNAPTRELL